MQNGSSEKTLSAGVDPKDDVAVLMDNTELSVFMPTRRHRQLSADSYNEVVDSKQIQLDRVDVNCELENGRIIVTVQFLQPFNGIIYSKGYKDDRNCK